MKQTHGLGKQAGKMKLWGVFIYSRTMIYAHVNLEIFTCPRIWCVCDDSIESINYELYGGCGVCVRACI